MVSVERLEVGEPALVLPLRTRNIKLVVEYDGTDFCGFQRQPGRRTVQGELERALCRIAKEPVRIAGAGRTDAGVHALGQVVSLRTACRIPVERVCVAANSLVGKDLATQSAEEAPEGFHARFSALSRTYRYTILNSEMPSALLRRFAHWVNAPLSVEPMEAAAEYLKGTHDFASFCASGMDACGTVRQLLELRVVRVSDLIVLTMQANAFLRSMARIISGTLIEVGIGKRTPEDIKWILAAKDRGRAGRTAPPCGLCLMSVEYPPETGP